MRQALRARAHSSYLAFTVHRISGLLLALFLPVHFYVLGLALTAPDQLDGFLHWTRQPLVKLSGAGLVLLLAVHLFGGVRILVLEFFKPGARHSVFIAASFCAALALALIFAMRVW